MTSLTGKGLLIGRKPSNRRRSDDKNDVSDCREQECPMIVGSYVDAYRFGYRRVIEASSAKKELVMVLLC